MRTIDLPETLPEETLALVDAATARDYGIVPAGVSPSGRIVLAGAGSSARERLAELEFILGPVELCAGAPEKVHALLFRHYSPGPVAAAPLPEAALLAESPEGAAAYVRAVLAHAAALGASDIHFEPGEDSFAVRLRVDGVLRSLPAAPAAAGPALIASLKLMAGLDIGLSRRPQDGRLAHAGSDMRLATLPTARGECAVVRILDAERRALDLDAIGMPPSCRKAVAEASAKSGLILSCGPTGSGKTTTLHAILREVGRPDLKILTVEDPVEYVLPGAVQVQARPETGLTFQRALRSFLRHDPDMILVGEIRDAATARTAMQAALTGHLVLASLHCSGAAQAPLRLTGLGLESWLVGSALELALAQRLVRRLCRRCGGKGCADCGESGYAGRTALFEWLALTPELSAHLDAGDAAGFLRNAAAAMETTMWKTGLALAEKGITTREEVAAQVDED
jgi:general secretion pathway protein E